SGAPTAASLSWGEASAGGLSATARSRACCLRRLRFSRSAAARRALRAARALALLPALPLVAIPDSKACPPPHGNAATVVPAARLRGHAPYGKDRRALSFGACSFPKNRFPLFGLMLP